MRLLVSPARGSEILWGKALYVTILGFFQLVTMFLFGWLVFSLNIYQSVPALLIMIVSTALACASLGMLLASVCKTQSQVGGLSSLVILGMSALGGSMFPSFIMPENIQKIGQFMLNHWAMKGMTGIFWRDLGTADILPYTGVLLGMALVFFLIARYLFQRRLFAT